MLMDFLVFDNFLWIFCVLIKDDKILPSSETALAVSSQDVSIPRTINLVSLLRLTQYFSEIDPSIS